MTKLMKLLVKEVFLDYFNGPYEWMDKQCQAGRHQRTIYYRNYLICSNCGVPTCGGY